MGIADLVMGSAEPADSFRRRLSFSPHAVELFRRRPRTPSTVHGPGPDLDAPERPRPSKEAGDRIGLAIAPVVAQRHLRGDGLEQGVLWRSDDSGEHWSLVTRTRRWMSGHSILVYRVDPRNPDHIRRCLNNLMESRMAARISARPPKETRRPSHHLDRSRRQRPHHPRQ